MGSLCARDSGTLWLFWKGAGLRLRTPAYDWMFCSPQKHRGPRDLSHLIHFLPFSLFATLSFLSFFVFPVSFRSCVPYFLIWSPNILPLRLFLTFSSSFLLSLFIYSSCLREGINKSANGKYVEHLHNYVDISIEISHYIWQNGLSRSHARAHAQTHTHTHTHHETTTTFLCTICMNDLPQRDGDL